MRKIIGLTLLLAGAYGTAHLFLPAALHLDRLAPGLAGWAWLFVPAGILVLVLGLGLTLKSGRGNELSDAPVLSTLKKSGFSITHFTGGWQATGTWKTVPVVVRRGAGYEASRFGRPWVIAVSLAGRPVEPWPLTPQQGSVVEVRGNEFTVSIPELSYPGSQGNLAQRLDAIVACRQ